ncbi:DNRLRE domain-containing protein [Bacillus sp. FJAT-47783]|uniref:DNRLRE domain-containing protein n=1 Tax=Bacillus sp. FJAT-47783 TaxID=2922712 RepID=UPI001FAB6B5A|nr:DNRLRE domain-containing protein [Bacillus sp. FJAT-47783]
MTKVLQILQVMKGKRDLMPPSFKSMYRSIAFLLSFCLIFSLIGPTFANAAPGASDRVPKKQRLQADIGELPDKLPKSKVELKSKRTKHSTRFFNPDGSFTEEIYLEPQFYQDPADKKWKKIDNTLKKSGKKPNKHVNNANDVKTWFANEANGNELVSVEKDGKSISLIPVQAKNVPGIVKNNEITYKGIFEQADVRYRVKGDAVKEDIILNSMPVENTFTFELKLKGLTAVTQENGTIVFQDQKGNLEWYLEKPYMTDANGKYSDKVTLKLREESGKTFVDVIADQAFLQDPETQYPVTIDPTIDNWDVIRDMFIASSYPDSLYSSETFMNTGYHGYFGSTRALIKFVLPSLPSDSKISSATFNAYQAKQDTSTVSIDLFRITSDWQTSTTTWNSQPSIGGSPESTTTDNAVDAYWQWDITQLAKNWYNGDQANYGMMLKQQNETSSAYRSFNTVNSGNNTPRITINYTVDPMGVEEFWSTTEEGVNPANGNLVLQETDVAVPGRGVEVEVSRTYNSRKSWYAGMFGYGWFSNVEALLVDSGDGPITLIDGDNTRHIFGQAIGGSYTTPGGLYLTLEKNQDGTYTITEKDDTKIHFNTSGRISSIVDTNGNTTTFTYNANGKLTSVQDASGRATTITYGTNGYVSSVTDSANRTTTYEYDAAGNLTKVIDPGNFATTFSYDADHNLKTITDARSITTTIGYDTSDRITSVSRPITINGVSETSTTTYSYDIVNTVTTVMDGEGKRVDYSYNGNGNITQITENPLDDQNKAVTTFKYDNNNNLTQVIDANSNQDGGSDSYIYTYDVNGNITGVQLPGSSDPENPENLDTELFTYDAQNNLTKEQDYNSNVNTFDYDQNNNQTESIDPYTQSVSQRYDNVGNLAYSTYPMSTADNLAENSSFEFENNSDNWPDHWTSLKQSGTTATFNWTSTNKFGSKAVSISNPTGWAVITSDKQPYDGTNYVGSGYVKTSEATNQAYIKVDYYDDQDNWLGQESSYGLKGTHDWTRLHVVADNAPTGTKFIRLTVGMDAGSGTAYFDGVQLEKGTVVSAYNLVNNSSFERDSNGDNLPDNWTTSSNISASDVMDTTNVYVGQYAYKLTGESGKDKYIKQHIDISGDSNTKLTLSGWSIQQGADPNGGYYALQIAINHIDGTTDWDFANDFSTTKTDWQHVAAEVKPKKAFDSIDVYYYYYNQTGTAWFDAMRLEEGASHTFNSYDTNGNYVTAVKNPLGNTISYQYDTAGNQTSVTDAKGQITSYQYDARNLLTKVIEANLKETTYGYDSVGNRTTVTDAKNNSTTYEYNEFNQISRIINPLNQAIQFEYNRNGDQTKVIYPNNNEISYTYNALNRLEKILYNGIEKWSYGYDANGNVTSVTDDTGKTTTYTYDKNKKVTQKAEGTSNTIDFSYDDNGNTTSIKVTAGTVQYTNDFTYNKLDQLITMARNNTEIVRFVYDERENVVSAIHTNGTYTAYEYDSNNRLKSVINYDANGDVLDKYVYTYDANGNWTGVATNNGSISYQYDSLNRLTQETLLDGTTISYEYDDVGNRTKKVVTQGANTTTINYTYDAGNQLTDVNSQAYTYDVNGNLTSNGNQTFVYNEDNRLIEVKDAGGTTLASFTYDHDGNRTSMTTSSGTINFHYDEGKVIYETDTSNNIIAEYTWDAEGNPVTMTKDGVTYYYHLNGHGDVTALTDENGNTVAEYDYDAWGNIVSQTGTMASVNPYRYASYRYDEATGLYYLMARYYDADTGRFLTRDKFRGFEDDPKSLNQYAYGHGNPVRYVDPEGNWVWLVFKAAIATYDGYKAYKKARSEGKRGYKLALAVAWAVAGNYIKVGKVYRYLSLAKKVGRQGKQARLKALLNDSRMPRHIRGWIKQELNSIKRKNRKTIRVPRGYHLAHKRGYEARKGYGYRYSDIQIIRNHKTQHKYDGYGRRR